VFLLNVRVYVVGHAVSQPRRPTCVIFVLYYEAFIRQREDCTLGVTSRKAVRLSEYFGRSNLGTVVTF
jgi:hypothetical protein